MFRTVLKQTTKIARCDLAPKVVTRGFAFTYKTSTGLPGLKVDPNGRENLLKLTDEVLDSVKKIPDCAYRVSVEQWFNYIKKVCTEQTDIRTIESEIGLGQIEEVIEDAKNERWLVDYYFEEKGWERVAHAQATADKVIEEMADSIFFSTPPELRDDPLKPKPPTDAPPK